MYSRAELSTPHSFQVRIADPDGTPIINPPMMQIQVADNPNLPAGALLTAHLMAVNRVDPLVFGQYGCDILVDGALNKSIPFQIMPAPGVPPQPRPA